MIISSSPLYGGLPSTPPPAPPQYTQSTPMGTYPYPPVTPADAWASQSGDIELECSCYSKTIASHTYEAESPPPPPGVEYPQSPPYSSMQTVAPPMEAPASTPSSSMPATPSTPGTQTTANPTPTTGTANPPVSSTPTQSYYDGYPYYGDPYYGAPPPIVINEDPSAATTPQTGQPPEQEKSSSRRSWDWRNHLRTLSYVFLPTDIHNALWYNRSQTSGINDPSY